MYMMMVMVIVLYKHVM